MSRASTPTLLSLDRYARLLGINPVHFSGAAGTIYWPDVGSCDDIWVQHPWQHPHLYISREELAVAISDAEQEIKEELGFSPAPVWETEEVSYYNAPMDHGVKYIPGAPSSNTSVQAEWGYIISAGVRSVTAIELASAVVLSDPDGDGWSELATVTAATTVTDKRQVKLYFAGEGAAPEWEIRPLKDVVITAGVATITLDSYLLLDPDLWDAVPTATSYGTPSSIDIEAVGNYVTTVDVYQEATDVSEASAEFLWEKNAYSIIGTACPSCQGAGCEVCALTTQDGCLSVRDAKAGIVTPFPGTYNSTSGSWVSAPFSEYRQPDQVKISYHAGYYDPKWLRGDSLDPLSDWFAQAIVWLATARIERGICACDNIQQYITELQRDMTKSTREAFFIRYESMDMFHCPWGTRVGEVRAWNRISTLTSKKQFDGGGF